MDPRVHSEFAPMGGSMSSLLIGCDGPHALILARKENLTRTGPFLTSQNCAFKFVMQPSETVPGVSAQPKRPWLGD